MTGLILLLSLGALASAADSSIFYSKSFPNSTPAYVSLLISPTGDIVYKEAVDDEQPVKLKIEPGEVAEIFALAEKLGHFDHPLESGLKVAFMGEKTYRWEADGKKNEQKLITRRTWTPTNCKTGLSASRKAKCSSSRSNAR